MTEEEIEAAKNLVSIIDWCFILCENRLRNSEDYKDMSEMFHKAREILNID